MLGSGHDEDVHDAGTSNMLSAALSGGGGDDSLRGGVGALRLSSSCAPGRVAGCDDRVLMQLLAPTLVLHLVCELNACLSMPGSSGFRHGALRSPCADRGDAPV